MNFRIKEDFIFYNVVVLYKNRNALFFFKLYNFKVINKIKILV